MYALDDVECTGDADADQRRENVAEHNRLCDGSVGALVGIGPGHQLLTGIAPPRGESG